MCHYLRAIVVGALLTTAADADGPISRPTQAGRSPVKVFVLAGQSNMEGAAVVDLSGADYNHGRGTLAALMRDPATAPLVAHLKAPDDTWAVRDDVWIRYQREEAPLLAGPLSIGYSVYGGAHHFGPELQFGHAVGEALDNQVLIVKTAWGGKSLNVDFRPPSSGRPIGPYYTRMISQIHDAMANLGTEFPAFKGGGCELAGFVWWHGWNDFCDTHAVPAYEENLVHFIRDVRRDLAAPALPFVIAEFTGPWPKDAPDLPQAAIDIREAQRAAAERPEFQGTVCFVETQDFVRRGADSPHPEHGHHEFGNAETYVLVGDAAAKGMLHLLGR